MGSPPSNGLMTNLMRRYCKCYLVPYTVDENNVFKSSKLRFYGNLGVTGIINVGTGALTFLASLDRDKLKENPYYVIGLIQLMLVVIYTLTTTTLFLIRQNNNLLDVFNKFAALEKITPLTSKEYFTVNRTLRWHLLFFIISAAFTTYSAGQNMPWVFIGLTAFAINAPEAKNLHFMITIAFLQTRMANIQEELNAIAKATPKRSEEINPFFIAWENSLKTKNAQGYHSTADKVRHLREKYAEIHHLKKQVNDIYGINLLVLICTAFYEGVFYTFWNITVFQYYGTEATAQINVLTYIRVSGYIAVKAIKITLVVATCQRWTDSATGIGAVVHDIINHVQDQETAKELLIFSTEIRHRDARITAAGFCNVDFSLLREIVGSVVMYIIILIQFKFTADLSKINPVQDMITFM